ncbi:flagellar export chaperone FlgN [Citricoccus sp.]|uniref:flagellar export chaperone FlgN n=1 Tax=Citricoccus sp. TaxID=1978372 RepID=UPI0028BDBD67|nr:flagellar export chaperone FlgN [Citricoccus sp.]
MQADELSNELWRERGILENLLYKFTTQRLLVTNGESRWLGRCTSEIEALKNQLSTTQLTVDVLSSSLAQLWGMTTEGSPTLRELVAAAPAEGPWAGILQDHHAAIVSLAEEIRTVSEENARFLKAANISLQEAGQQTGPAVTYTAAGSAAPTSGAAIIDRQG